MLLNGELDPDSKLTVGELIQWRINKSFAAHFRALEGDFQPDHPEYLDFLSFIFAKAHRFGNWENMPQTAQTAFLKYLLAEYIPPLRITW
jgi:hypothetical protein